MAHSDKGTKEKIKTAAIITNCFKTPLLRSIFWGCLIVSVVFPAYSALVIIPSYTEMLIKNTEDEALRTGTHLLSYIDASEIVNSDSIPEVFINEIDKVEKAFKIYKLKIFSNSGNTIFSTNPREIGELNTKDYFREIVAKGKPFTKVVTKDSKSSEGQVVTSDVAEIYIPIMNADKFRGAFEIYYDITSSKERLDNLLSRSKIVLFTLASILLSVTIIFLLKTSKTIIERS